ncbi:MAG: tetratricopeptide repeat protein [Desulfobaccales bacterium]
MTWKIGGFMWRVGLVAVLLLALVGCSRKDTPDKYLQEGFSNFQQQDYDGAIKNYEQAITLGVKSANAYNMLGMAYRFKSQQTHDPALQESELISFQKAVELDPKYLPAVINLAATYHSRGDQAQAAVWFKKALALNPNPQEKAQIDKLIAGGAAAAPKKSHGQ